jgi:hypothetical protein
VISSGSTSSADQGPHRHARRPASTDHPGAGGGLAERRFLQLAQGPFRAPDPYLDVQPPFIVRRIAADSRKVALGSNPGRKVPAKLLEAMGFDLGAVHAASRSRHPAVLRDLDARPADWLRGAAKVAAEAVDKDFGAWRSA